APPATPPSQPSSGRHGSAEMIFTLRDAKIHVIDDPSATRLEFVDVQGQGTWAGEQIRLSSLQGQLNGGTFELSAQIDRSAGAPMVDGNLRARGVDLGAGMNALGYLVPLVGGRQSELGGRLDLSLYVRGHGVTKDELLKSLTGQGAVALDPV